MRVLLLGTYDPQCVLHKLYGHEDVLRKIYARTWPALPTILARDVSNGTRLLKLRAGEDAVQPEP